MEYGKLIHSVVDADTILHIGDPNVEFIRSVMYSMDHAKIFCAESDFDMGGEIIPIGSIDDIDPEKKFDIISFPANSNHFATAIYIAQEYALREGGIVVVYGEGIEARRSLLISMIKEGTLASFSWSSFVRRDIMIFLLDSETLIRSM